MKPDDLCCDAHDAIAWEVPYPPNMEAERAEIVSEYARSLINIGEIDNARKIIADLNLDNRKLSMIRLEIGLQLLKRNQSAKAIELLEASEPFNLENEHYMFKRSVALICAYQRTGRYASAQKEWEFIRNLQIPDYAWKFDGWWGDVNELLNTYKVHRQIH